MARQKNGPSRFSNLLTVLLGAAFAAILFSFSLPLSAAAPNSPAGDLAVYVIDVGEGDATLVVGPDGTTLLIDGGGTGQGPAAILPLMHSLGIGRLDYMVATHYDEDHIGGLDEVANGGYFPGVANDGGDYGGTPGTTAYYQYASAIASVRRTIAPGNVIPLEGGATATCLVVNGELMGGGSVDILGSSEFENSACVGLLIEDDDFQYLTLDNLSNAAAAIPILQTTRGTGALGGVDMGGTFTLVTDGSSYRVEKDGKTRLRFLVDEDGTDSPGPGDLVVSEYMNNPAIVSDSYGEYFEIFNASTEDLSLRGIEVRDDDYDSFLVASNVIAPAGERIDFTGLSAGSNFAEATTPFGLGDLGTPGAKNSVDASDTALELAIH